jgi:hypothetical protein
MTQLSSRQAETVDQSDLSDAGLNPDQLFNSLLAKALNRDPVDAVADAAWLVDTATKSNGRVMLVLASRQREASYWLKQAARDIARLDSDTGRGVATALLEKLEEHLTIVLGNSLDNSLGKATAGNVRIQ